jgi:pyruvate/2-oxoglutarate dehydrogenase complex dihydrolipoamide acyltransferase (E2) component
VTEPAVGEKHYSPFVRRLAEQHGVDLSQIEGTGQGGRVTREDVLAAVEKHTGRPAVTAPPAEKVKEVAAPPAAPPAASAEEEVIPLTGMRKLIAEHMVRSKRTAPHVTTITDVDMTEVVKLREAAKEAFHQKHGVKLTYMPFIIQSTARGLREYPLLNSSLVEENIILKKHIHIGIAVSIESGLIVPVIKDADKRSIVELAKAVEDLAARARAGKLKPDDIHGGTFSITNPGVFGGLLSTPIIFQPQAAILGVQRISKMPVVINDAIAIRSVMYLCMSYDHRIVDGATSVQFLQFIRRQLEECKFSLEMFFPIGRPDSRP